MSGAGTLRGSIGERAVDVSLWALAAAAVGAIVALSLALEPPALPAPDWGDKAGHAGAYAVATALLLLAAVWRPGRGGGPFPGAAWAISAGMLALGVGLEATQAALPARAAEWLDVAADASGIGGGWLGWRLLRPLVAPRGD